MLELIKIFLEKIDFLAIAEAVRKKKNRRIAARLHLILVQAFEIIELYRVLLLELREALKSHRREGDRDSFYLNPARIASILDRQASNLQVMETLTSDLMDELRIIDNKFLEAYRSLLPGKFGVLFEAQGLLMNARLPLVESAPQHFPATETGEYRTLWFTWEAPKENRKEIEKYLYGDNGKEKKIIDVNIHDGDAFFREIERYFDQEDPLRRLSKIEELTENYKNILLKNFSLEDLLSDIGKVRKH